MSVVCCSFSSDKCYGSVLSVVCCSFLLANVMVVAVVTCCSKYNSCGGYRFYQWVNYGGNHVFVHDDDDDDDDDDVAGDGGGKKGRKQLQVFFTFWSQIRGRCSPRASLLGTVGVSSQLCVSANIHTIALVNLYSSKYRIVKIHSNQNKIIEVAPAINLNIKKLQNSLTKIGTLKLCTRKAGYKTQTQQIKKGNEVLTEQNHGDYQVRLLQTPCDVIGRGCPVF